jgi:hypothetical protein
LQGGVFEPGDSSHFSSRNKEIPIAAAAVVRLMQEIQVRMA